jgi:sulfate permease, SulP family
VLLAVLVALFLAPVLDDLPQATLAAIVIVATLGLISIKEFAASPGSSRSSCGWR